MLKNSAYDIISIMYVTYKIMIINNENTLL